MEVMSPDTTMQDGLENSGQPYLKITEEPQDEFRFRYQSEMQGAHGAILGKTSNKNRKTFPSVMLCNFKGKARIRCTLATAGDDPSVHAHRLVAKLPDREKEKDDPHDIEVGPYNFVATFQNMVIIHIEKKKVVEVLEKKIKNLIALRFPDSCVSITPAQDRQIKEQAKLQAENMDMNQVSLKFEALVLNERQQFVEICDPVYTVPINNLKSHLRGKLKICRIDKHIGSCRGNDEVFIFVEKVAKKNIKVQFFELSSDGKEIWCDDAKFGENDVHHQYAIAFRTPPYRTPDITRNVDVYIRLVRPSDGSFSNHLEFQYKPDYVLKKRRISSDLPLEDLSLHERNVLPSLMMSPMMSPDTTAEDLPRCELLEKFVDDINDDDFRNIFGDDLGIDIEPAVTIPADTSFNEIMAQLPTPVSEEFHRYLSALYSSGEDFDNYKKTVMDSGLHPEHMITTDGVITPRKTNTSNRLDRLLRLKINIVKDEESPVLNRILFYKKRGQFNKDKFSQYINYCFKYPLDSQQNRVLHLALHQGGKLSVFNQFIDFLTQPGIQDYTGDKSELLNIQNAEQQTPLHIAVAEGLASAVSKLMSSGLADPNKQDFHDKTPLHYAVQCAESNGQDGLNILQTLIDSPSCNANEICEEGTALHLAVREKQNFQILNILLKHPSVDVNVRGGSARGTVLHIAVENVDISTVKFLVLKCKEYGKRLEKDIRNTCGYTPLELCYTLAGGDVEKSAKAEEIAQYLIQSEKSLETDITDKENEVEDVKPNKESLYNLKHQAVEKSSNKNEAQPKRIVNKTNTSSLQLKMPKPLDLNIKTEEEDDETILGYNEENGLFDKKALKELKAILDKDEAWAKLAALLGYKKFVDNFRGHASPSLMLLTYVEKYGNSMGTESDIINDIHENLITANLMDAVRVISDMVIRKRTRTVLRKHSVLNDF